MTCSYLSHIMIGPMNRCLCGRIIVGNFYRCADCDRAMDLLVKELEKLNATPTPTSSS